MKSNSHSQICLAVIKLNAQIRRGTGSATDSNSRTAATARKAYQNMRGHPSIGFAARNNRSHLDVRCKPRQPPGQTSQCTTSDRDVLGKLRVRRRPQAVHCKPVLTSVTAGQFTIRGVSVGGVY